jgi:hypothetical protein
MITPSDQHVIALCKSGAFLTYEQVWRAALSTFPYVDPNRVRELWAQVERVKARPPMKWDPKLFTRKG